MRPLPLSATRCRQATEIQGYLATDSTWRGRRSSDLLRQLIQTVVAHDWTFDAKALKGCVRDRTHGGVGERQSCARRARGMKQMLMKI